MSSPTLRSHRVPLDTWLLVRTTLLVCALAACAGPAPVDPNVARFELSGDWYVLVHYTDDRSKSADVKKFKDFVWSIEAQSGGLRWYTYPFAIFDDEREAARRDYMTSHRQWEPDPDLLGQIRKQVKVSNRGAQDKRLIDTGDGGFRSPARRASSSLNTLDFTRDWTVTRGIGDEISIRIVDSLGGAQTTEDLTATTLYVIEQRVSRDELRGTYREGHKQGSFRMIRTKARASR